MLIKLYAARDALEAHFVRSLLENEGIRAAVMGETLGTSRGDLPLTQETLPAVWIDDEDLARAQPVLDAFRNQPPPSPATRTPWRCPACGEDVEGQFTSCWNCGAERAEDTSAGA